VDHVFDRTASQTIGIFRNSPWSGSGRVLTPILGASAGTFTRWLYEGLPPSEWLVVWSGRWLHDVLGLLCLLPPSFRFLNRASRVEGLGPQAAAVIGPILLALSWSPGSRSSTAIQSVLFFYSCMILAAAWLEQSGPGLAALVIAAMAIWSIPGRQLALCKRGAILRRLLSGVHFLHALAVSHLRRCKLCCCRGQFCWPAGSSADGCTDRSTATVLLWRVANSIPWFGGRARRPTADSKLPGGSSRASEFLSAATRVDQEAWHVYVDRLQVMDRYPGNSTMAILQPVASADLERFAAEQRGKEVPALRSTSH